MGQIVMLQNVRLSFPKLDEPEYFQGQKQRPDDKPRWSAAFHVSPESTGMRLNEQGQPTGAKSPAKALIDTLLREVAAAQWTTKDPKGKPVFETHLLNILPDPKGCCWVDGARKGLDDGLWILNSHRGSDKGRPLVMDNDKSPIYKPNNELYEGKAGRVYSGCFVNAQVEFWAQDNKAGKGLRCTLMGIQRLRDGDAFSGGSAPQADAFAEVADGSDADDLS